MHQVTFHCPRCRTHFPVVLQEDQYSCPECGSSFRLVHDRRGVDWVSNDSAPQWLTCSIQPVNERFTFQDKEDAPLQEIGAARVRRLKRHRLRSRRRALTCVFLSIVLFAFSLLTPLASPMAHAISSSAESLLADAQSMAAHHADLPVKFSTQTEIQVPGFPSHTPTRIQPSENAWLLVSATATATLYARPSATPTPLPPTILAATAWQATLAQAVIRSHNIQTANAIEYSATQAALPPLLTEMAGERAAIATQTAQAGEVQ